MLSLDHLGIATGISDLALTYGALRQHQEALQIKMETLALRKRLLPSDPRTSSPPGEDVQGIGTA